MTTPGTTGGASAPPVFYEGLAELLSCLELAHAVVFPCSEGEEALARVAAAMLSILADSIDQDPAAIGRAFSGAMRAEMARIYEHLPTPEEDEE